MFFKQKKETCPATPGEAYMRAFGCYKVEATGELETDGMCAYGRTGGSLHRMVMIWTRPNTLEPDARVMELIDFEKQC